MEYRKIITLLISGLFRISGAFPANGDLDYEFRANAELVCYECARTPDNDTCAFDLKHIPEVTAVGQNFRCRVYEMDGTVVARGIVPSVLCTPQAFAQINLNMNQLAKTMNANGPVHASCCNSNHCNVDFCTSEGRIKDCSTLVSVLKGEIATYVDSEKVKKQIDVNEKSIGAGKNVAVESSDNNVDDNNTNIDEETTLRLDNSNNNNSSTMKMSTTTTTNGTGTSTKTVNGTSTTTVNGTSTTTGNNATSTTGSNSTTEAQFEIVAGNLGVNGTNTNVTASSKFSSSLQLESEAALEPLTSRKSDSPASLRSNGALTVALLLMTAPRLWSWQNPK